MQSANKWIIILLIAAAAFFIIWNNFYKFNPDEVIATVNDEEITNRDLVKAKNSRQSMSSSADEDKILKDLIRQKIAKIYAKKSGLAEKPEVKEEFKQQEREIKKGVLVNYYLEQKGAEVVKLTNEDYKEYLDQNPYVKIKTIFFPVEGKDTTEAYEEAQEAFQELQAGNKFDQVREDYMEKDYLKNLNETELIQESLMQNIIGKKLEVGQYSKPTNTPNGFYIVKRLQDPPVEELKKQIKGNLLQSKKNQYLMSFIDSLRNEVVYANSVIESYSQDPSTINGTTNLAELGDKNLTIDELEGYFRNYGYSEKLKDMRLQALKKIIGEILIQDVLYDESVQAGIDETEGFKEKWESEKTNYNYSREDFLVNKVYNTVIADSTEVTEEDIQQYYENNKEEFMKNGEPQPIETVKYDIKYDLQDKKLNNWFDKVKEKYNIVVEKK